MATGMDVSSARISSRFFRLPQASSPMTNGCVTLPKTVEFHVFLRGRDGGPRRPCRVFRQNPVSRADPITAGDIMRWMG